MLGNSLFLKTIKVKNLLSFGPNAPELELRPLNVLNGPNGAGKSNLIEVVSLLQAASRNLFEAMQTGGGILEWLWKGSGEPPTAQIDATIGHPEGKMPLRHRLDSSAPSL